jgi:prepilin-type N-terminal cleavage/methylation domain-containing protein
MAIKKKIKNASGFSLIELLVAVFIFVLIIMAATETFTSTFSAWTKTRRTQTNLENARTALETIGKSIRMSNQLKYSSGVLSMFNHSQNKCLRYRSGALGSLESSTCAIKEPNPPTDPFTYDCSKDACDGGNSYGSWLTLVNSDFELYFNVVETKKDSDVNNNVVGKATISALVGSGVAEHERIQTTVSFRDFKDFFYVTAP